MIQMIFNILKPDEEEGEIFVSSFLNFHKQKSDIIVSDPTLKGHTPLESSSDCKPYSNVLDDLYRNLDTIDTKASILLAFYAIVSGFALLVIQNSAVAIDTMYAIFILVLSLFSLSILLTIIYIHWIKPERLSYENLKYACTFFYDLREVRTKIYHFSWMVMIALVISPVVFIFIKSYIII